MIELRWFKPKPKYNQETNQYEDQPQVLEYRKYYDRTIYAAATPVNRLDSSWTWSPWMEVPTVLERDYY